MKLTSRRVWRPHYTLSPVDGKTTVCCGISADTSIGRYSISPVYTDHNGARKLVGHMVYFISKRSVVRESDRWHRLRRDQTGSGLLNLTEARALCQEHFESHHAQEST